MEAGSILMVMSLGIAKGDQVTVTVDGDDAGSVADALVAKLTQAE